MSFDTLLSRTGAILPFEEGERDTLNNPITGYGEAVPTVYYMEQRRADERLEDRDTRITDYLLVLPATATFTARDRFQDADDAVYEVDGDPWHVWNPRTDSLHHIEATVRRIEG